MSKKDIEDLKVNGLYLFDLCKGLIERYQIDYDATLRSDNKDLSGERDLSICKQLEYELAIISGTGFLLIIF